VDECKPLPLFSSGAPSAAHVAITLGFVVCVFAYRPARRSCVNCVDGGRVSAVLEKGGHE
jgi:hypothetical protein